MNWNKSKRPAFVTLKTHIPQIMTIINKEYHDPISSNQVITFIDKTPSHLINEKIMHEYYTVNKEHVYDIAPKTIKPLIPSIIQSIIPTTLLRPCRQIKENRLDNFCFITSFRRSHRMPLFHENRTLICPCKKNRCLWRSFLLMLKT